MRYLILVSLFLSGVYEASSEEPWGIPLDFVATADIEDFSIDNFEGKPAMDETGRVWRIVGPLPYNRHLLATWENGIWHPVQLVPSEMMSEISIPLHIGPEGRVVFGWRDKNHNHVITELRGMWYRHAPPTPLAANELQLYEDSQGQAWVNLQAFCTSHGILARPEELKHIMTIPLTQAEIFAQKSRHAIPAYTDGQGHYGFNLGNIEHGFNMGGIHVQGTGTQAFFPILVDLENDWQEITAKKLRPKDWTAPFCLLKSTGEMHFSTPIMPEYVSDVIGAPIMEPKDNKSFWVTSNVAIWEVDWSSLECQSWLCTLSEETGMPQGNILGHKGIRIYPKGPRWILTNDSKVHYLEREHLLPLLPQTSRTIPLENSFLFLVEENVKNSSMALLQDESETLTWLGRPKGVSLDEIEGVWPTGDGGLVIAYPHDVITFSREELEKLVSTTSFSPESSRCRLFRGTWGPIMMPDGRFCIFSAYLLGTKDLFILENNGWILHSPDIPEGFSDGTEWALADNQNRIWVLTSRNVQNTPCFCYDPATNETKKEKTLLEVLSDADSRPSQFYSYPNDYRVPVMGKNNNGVMVTYNDFYFCIDGAWQNAVSIYDAIDRSNAPKNTKHYYLQQLDGPCYFDEQDILCVESKGLVYTFSPESKRFTYASSREPRYAVDLEQVPHLREPSGNMSGDDITIIFGYSGAHAEKYCRHRRNRARYTNWFVDPLGITWSWKDNSLIREAYGIRQVALQGRDADPLRSGINVQDITYDNQGGAFIRGAHKMSAHIRLFDSVLETQVKADLLPDQRVQLNFNSGPGLQHAWRLDNESWSHSDKTEIVIGPITPGSHTIEVYAFDNELNVDSTPSCISIEAAFEDTPESLLTVFLKGDNTRRQWAIERLRGHGEKGIAVVKKALAQAKEESAQWRLETLLQQLEKGE